MINFCCDKAVCREWNAIVIVSRSKMLAPFALYVILLALLLLLLLVFVLGSTFTYWQRRGVECFIPSSGATLRRFLDTLLFGRIDLDAFRELYQLMGDRPFAGVYMVTRPVLVVKDPELIRRIHTKDFQHFVDFGFNSNVESDPIAKTLVHLKGREWKATKPRLSSAFAPAKVRDLALQTFVRRSDDVLAVLAEHERDSRPVEVLDLCRRYSIDCFVGPYLGLDDVNTIMNERGELVEITRVCVQAHYIRHLLFSALYPAVHRFLGMHVTTKPVREFFQRFVKKLIVERRERGQSRREDFLQTLIDMRDEYEQLSSDERPEYSPVIDDFFMVAQVFIFFVAGFETASKTLSFCLYELALQPDIQQKIRDEARRVLGDNKGSIITEEMLQDLKYTWQVLSETMRKYPVFSMTFRRCTQDYKIPNTDVIIEKETLVLIPRCAIHWDSKHYPDPERFDPERFNEENEQKRNPGTYLPFGAGPRICSGAYLAQTEMKILLARVLLEYEITLNEKTISPLEYDPTEFILTPKYGVFLNVHKLKT